MQYLLSTKQIHHGQPPFEHLRPASAPLLRCRRLPGNPPARETGLGLGHGEHTPAQPAAQLPRGLSATYLGPCKERWPSWTRGAGPEPSQMGSEDPGEEIVPFPVLGHETGITGQRLFPFARCLGTRTLRERPLWATVCGSGGQVTQSVCRCTHSPPTTRSSEPPGRTPLAARQREGRDQKVQQAHCKRPVLEDLSPRAAGTRDTKTAASLPEGLLPPGGSPKGGPVPEDECSRRQPWAGICGAGSAEGGQALLPEVDSAGI